jgi:5'(3')-deoxyribonucleotidase
MGIPRMQMPKIPKVREHAELVLTDGTVMKGYVFVDATVRIQDLLNAPNDFFPFIDEQDVVHLISKRHVVHVRPFD